MAPKLTSAVPELRFDFRELCAILGCRRSIARSIVRTLGIRARRGVRSPRRISTEPSRGRGHRIYSLTEAQVKRCIVEFHRRAELHPGAAAARRPNARELAERFMLVWGEADRRRAWRLRTGRTSFAVR
jgi:hypothetical protein